MTNLTIHADAEKRLDLDHDRLVAHGQLTSIGLLRHGTSEGRASVAMVITMADGSQVLAETTWRLLQMATRALAQGSVGREETLD